MKVLSILIVITCLVTGCSSTNEKTTALSGPEAVTQTAEAEAIKVRKHIKDVDYRNLKADRSPKKRIVILPFLDKQDNTLRAQRPESVKTNAYTAFVNELNNQETMVVLDSSQLNLELSKYLKDNEYDLLKIAKDSKKLGITSLVEGQIIDVRLKHSGDQVGIIRQLKAVYEVVVRMKIVNIKSEQEVFHTVKTVTLEEDNTRIAERVSSDQFFIKNPELVEILIKDAFLDFSGQLNEVINEVTWEGRIAAIRGEKIYLNVGQISGVRLGDILKVVEDGSELYDPEMGSHLGKIQGRVKGTLEVVSYFGQDGAVAVLHSGAGFKESDRVEIYQ